jgi:starvation-inducible DNA-binding protein
MSSVSGFLTGRCIASKAKPDKVSSDLDTPTDLPQEAVDKISAALNTLLADAFALYLKTKNFHWHVKRDHPVSKLLPCGSLMTCQA